MRSVSRLQLRRAAMIAATALGLGVLPATAQQELTVMGHAVHQTAATGEKGGSMAAEFTAETGAEVRWLTYGVVPIHEQLFRDATLSTGSVDVGLVLNRFANENIANLFEPLDELIASDPIEGFDGIAPGMLDAMRFDGKIYGIPYRHATHGLLYNEAMLAEQGLEGPPETFEELLEYAEKLTYTRPDGTQVNGLVLSGTGSSNIIDIVRAYGGEFITPEFEIKASEEGMVSAVTKIADLYQRGILPRESVSFTTEDATTYMQQGRAAMAIDPFSRFATLNDPERSNFPGEISVAAIPASAEMIANGTALPVKTEIWSLAIPRNAPNKELAWAFIQKLSSPQGTIAGAINGNGPVRQAAYQDAGVQGAIPYWAAEAAAVTAARVPIPGFSESARVDDMLKEEMQAVMLGAKTPQQAMDDLTARAEPLLPN